MLLDPSTGATVLAGRRGDHPGRPTPLSACRASRTSSSAQTGSPAGRDPGRRTGPAIANSATSSPSQYTANSPHWLPEPMPRWSIS